MNITAKTCIDPMEEKAIRMLMDQCQSIDGSRPVIQLELQLNYYKTLKAWVLCYVDTTLIGVLTLFGPSPQEIEISACVLPSWRKQGVFSALVKRASQELGLFNQMEQLWLCEAGSSSGKAYLEDCSFKVVQTEYTMRYGDGLPLPKLSSRLLIRSMKDTDIQGVVEVQMSAFSKTEEQTRHFLEDILTMSSRKNFVATLKGEVIGFVTLWRDECEASINGFAIHTNFQGQGLGREFMGLILQELKKTSSIITLDVSSENHRAYTLYKSVGFENTHVVEYYKSTEKD